MGDVDRQKLIKLCAEHCITIISDDVYHLMTWGDTPAPRSLRAHALELGKYPASS